MNKIIKIIENASCIDEDQEINRLKDLEKEFAKTLKKANKEIQVCLDEIGKCSKQLYSLEDTVYGLQSKLQNLSEKYGVPVTYSFNGTEFWYAPKSFLDFKEKVKDLIISNQDIINLLNDQRFYYDTEWQSSSC